MQPLSEIGGVMFTVGVFGMVALRASSWDASREARRMKVTPGSSYAARQFGRQTFLTFVIAITVSPLIGAFASFFFDAAREGESWGGAALVSLIILVLFVSAYLVWRVKEAIEDDHGHPATVWRDVDDQNTAATSGRSVQQWAERVSVFKDSIAGGRTATERELLREAASAEWRGGRDDVPEPHIIAEALRGDFPLTRRRLVTRYALHGLGLILASGGFVLIAGPYLVLSADDVVRIEGVAGLLAVGLFIAFAYMRTARLSRDASDVLRLTRRIHFHLTCLEAEAAIARLERSQLRLEKERRAQARAICRLERILAVLEATPLSRLKKFMRRGH